MKRRKYNVYITFDICSFTEVITSNGVIFKVLTRKYVFKGAEVNHCDTSCVQKTIEFYKYQKHILYNLNVHINYSQRIFSSKIKNNL